MIQRTMPLVLLATLASRPALAAPETEAPRSTPEEHSPSGGRAKWAGLAIGLGAGFGLGLLSAHTAFGSEAVSKEGMMITGALTVVGGLAGMSIGSRMDEKVNGSLERDRAHLRQSLARTRALTAALRLSPVAGIDPVPDPDPVADADPEADADAVPAADPAPEATTAPAIPGGP